MNTNSAAFGFAVSSVAEPFLLNAFNVLIKWSLSGSERVTLWTGLKVQCVLGRLDRATGSTLHRDGIVVLALYAESAGLLRASGAWHLPKNRCNL